MKQVDRCCICRNPILGFGNNAEPVKKGRCCDVCNMSLVLPLRFAALKARLYDEVEAEEKN